MGTSYGFRCPQCGYEACVPKGRSVGMMAVTRSCVCTDCRQLVQVLIGAHGRDGPTGDPEFDRDLNTCPRCTGKNLRRWTRQRCPRCGGSMDRTDVVVMWD